MRSKQSPDATSSVSTATPEFDPTLPQHRPEHVLDNTQPPKPPTPLKLTVTIKPPDPIHDVPCITQVRPNLFIGNYAATKRPELLEEHRITAIVSLKATDCLAELEAISRFTSFVPKGRHLWVKISDQSKSDLLAFFEYICDFIDKMMATPPELWNDKPNPDGPSNPIARGVLVHCQAGISRSATATVAYLMRKEGLGFAHHAVTNLKQIHPRSNPNRGLRRQLEIWRECNYAGIVGKTIEYQVMRPYLEHLIKERMALPEKDHTDRLMAFMSAHVYTKDITAEPSPPVLTSQMTALDASAYARSMFACLR